MSASEFTNYADSSLTAEAKATQLIASRYFSPVITFGMTTEMALEANPASRSARLSLSDCPVDKTCILTNSG